VEEIKRSKPSVVFNTINGDSNLAFYYYLHKSGIRAEKIPVMAFSIGEVELKDIGPSIAGHYACSGYFQCLDSPENKAFINRFQARYGRERVVSDAVAGAYTQPFLWKELVERCGTFDVSVLKQNIPGTSHCGPGGTITIHRNHHAFKPALIGRANEAMQFDMIWQSPEWIKPLPWLGLEEIEFTGKDMIMAALGSA
jgi:urea transport system substrate-binding protein